MSSKDAHLYGIPRPSKPATNPKKSISSSNTLSFSNALSSLISASSQTPPTTTTSTTLAGRPRPRRKDDIFAKPNPATKKRALADLSSTTTTNPALSRPASENALDDSTWRRTKRKLEDKARLYAAMKRGDVEDTAEKHMVDFDRKWADSQAPPTNPSASSSSDSSDAESTVSYTDEFGRSRRGTRAEAARVARAARAGEELAGDRFTARPVAPTNIIYGDTVQAGAFNPEEPVAAAMEALAAKRDRELTPPAAMHYDAKWEVRTRGTGFFAFSGDEEERRREMEGLEGERRETERVRGERERGREERRRVIEERKRVLGKRRGRVLADRFLDALGEEIGSEESEVGKDQAEGREEK